MSDRKPLISVCNVGVTFKNNHSLFSSIIFEALRNVSFNLYRGDSLGIIGRNGAGKTTILRLLGGIIRPDKGFIKNNNVSTTLLALQVGFDLELSGRINAILSGMLLGFRKKEVMANLENIISFSELHNFIDLPVKTYSAGMRARLGFSVAFKLSPDVLLIDEVLGVGDAEFREKSLAIMREKLLSDQTIVLVSHDAKTIRNLCNRAVWVERGTVRMEGDSVQVVDAYEGYLLNKGKV